MHILRLIKKCWVIVFFVFTACNTQITTVQNPILPVKVTLLEVSSSEVLYFDNFPATLIPLNQIELRPQVTGFITAVHFKDGDRVKKEQLLYDIDAQLYSANHRQAIAGLKVQEANFNKAQKDVNRYHQLDLSDAVAKQLVDNAEAALEIAKRQVEASQANIQAVQTGLKYTKVFAPFEGVIGISLVKPGASVTAGQTLLNVISSDQDLGVDFNVDQKEIYRFTGLLAKSNQLGDSTFTLSFGNDVYAFPGKVEFIDRAVNAQTGSIKVRLIFPNPNKLLIAGMTGTIRVRNDGFGQAVVIPYKAVTEQLGEYFVYVSSDSNTVSQRKVSLGKLIGTVVVVNNGLQTGEKIVVEGIQNLKEGAKIVTSEKKTN